MNAADALKRAIAGTQGRTQQPITDEFAKAIAKRLESRGIVKVPGLEDDEPESESDRIRAALDRYEAAARQVEAEREAKLQAEQEAAEAQRTTPDLIRQAMAETHPTTSKATIPLNGAAVLRAALAGGPGTINGGTAE
jgi:hypothetical protein